MQKIEVRQDGIEALSDEEAVSRIRAGDTRLFEDVMRRNNQRVYRAVRAVLRDDGEIEDVMQQTYLNAYAHLHEYSGRARFSTWLIRIAVHEAFARLRRQRREPIADFDTEQFPMASPSRGPEDLASNHELRIILERAVDALPEAFRTVFVLRGVERLSTDETAEALDIAPQTVKTRFHRARAQLRKALTERAGAALPGLFDFHLERCDRIVAGVLAGIAGNE